MVRQKERRAGFQRLCPVRGQPCHGFPWGPSETSLGESSVCSGLPGVLRHPMAGSGLQPPPQSTRFPGARAFLLSSSAQDALGPCPCEWRGCWLQSQGRGLWRGTTFTSAVPGVTSAGTPWLCSCQLGCAKGDASGKTSAARASFLRPLQVTCERHAPRGEDIEAPYLACSAAQRSMENLCPRVLLET